ncbi:hypothetical protein ACFLYO_05415 [Chloroflexota bacterium]
MRIVQPHEFFYLDFEQILPEAERQESLLPVNKGEYAIAHKIYTYFDDVVMPAIINDDWVYAAAREFATEHAGDCFRTSKRTGEETLSVQNNLLEINEQVVNFVAQAAIEGWAHQVEGELTKESDFYSWLNFDKLSKIAERNRRHEARQLQMKAKEHEDRQLWTTLQVMRETYEVILPRIVYVLRRVIKTNQGLLQKPTDEKLLGISEAASWFESHIDCQHPLYIVLGKESLEFYRIARNVASHHEGYEWRSEKDEVILIDRSKSPLRVHVHEFQQRYRYSTMYVCDFGMRAILAAFCRRERGSISNSLVDEYINTFPDKFPVNEVGILKPYDVTSP